MEALGRTAQKLLQCLEECVACNLPLCSPSKAYDGEAELLGLPVVPYQPSEMTRAEWIDSNAGDAAVAKNEAAKDASSSTFSGMHRFERGLTPTIFCLQRRPRKDCKVPPRCRCQSKCDWRVGRNTTT